MNTIKASVKSKLMHAFHYHLVEEGELLLIIRDGQVRRLHGPGYVWVNPLVDEIAILQSGPWCRTFLIPLQTSDCIPIEVLISVHYGFLPQLGVESLSFPLARRVATDENQLTVLMEQFVRRAVGQMLGQLPVEKLFSQRLAQPQAEKRKERMEIVGGLPGRCQRSQLESTIVRFLQQEVMALGIRLLKPAAISIEQISIPHELEKAFILARVCQTLSDTFQLPSSVLEHWLLTERTLAAMGANGSVITLMPSMQELSHWLPSYREARRGEQILAPYRETGNHFRAVRNGGQCVSSKSEWGKIG